MKTDALKAEYEKPVQYETGKEIKFKDFSILLEEIKTISMGVFDNSERFRTDYHFLLTLPKNKTEKFTWSTGFPGGMPGPRMVKVGRRNNFSIEFNPTYMFVRKEKDGPEYGEKITFTEGTIMEYPDFDLTLISENGNGGSQMEFSLTVDLTTKKLNCDKYNGIKTSFSAKGKNFSMEVKKINYNEQGHLVDSNQIIIEEVKK